MEAIEKYFKEKTKEVTFIELKDNSHIKLKDLIIEEYIPLPIMTEQLIRNIKDGKLEEEINMSYIIEGIIYILGVDTKFPYINEYKSILMTYNETIKEYIFHDAIKDLEKGNYDNSAIKLRALLILDKNNVNALLNYAIAVEEIAKIYIMDEKQEEGEQFLIYSTKILENILNINEDFAPAYYKLGYHYRFFGQFLKADLTWKKFLLLSRDELLVQEIREETEVIKDDVNMETGLTYLNYSDYNKALDAFLELIPKHKDNWNVNFLIGRAYSGLEQWDLAIDYMKKSFKLNPSEADIYNELGIIYFNLGDISGALDIFTEGIKNCEGDYKLYFNRGLGHVQLEEYEKGLDDINKAFELNPTDENIKYQKKALEKLV